MSYIACLEQKARDGEISPNQLRFLTKKYTELTDKYTAAYEAVGRTAEEAEGMAAVEVGRQANEMQAEAYARALQPLKERVALQKIEDKFNALTAAWDANSNSFKQVFGLFGARPTRGDAAQWLLNNTDLDANYLPKKYLSGLDKAIERIGEDAVTRLMRTTDGGIDLTKAIIDGRGSPEALELAAYFRGIREQIDRDYRGLGGYFDPIDGYFPQQTKAERLNRDAFDEDWYRDITAELDREKMIDWETGLPLTDAKLRELAVQIWEDITTDGESKLLRHYEKTGQPMKKDPTYVRRAHARFFHFKDADAFIRYNAKYGIGNEGLSQVYLNDIIRMAKTNAVMDTFGPIPSLAWKSIQGWQGRPSQVADAMYETLTGHQGYSHETGFYRFVMGAQNLLKSSMLGGAIISSTSDAVAVKLAADMSGMSGMDTLGKFFTAMSKEDKQALVNSHNLFEMITNHANAASRVGGGGDDYAFAGAAEKVMWAQGMNWHVSNMENTASWALAHNLGEYLSSGKRFDELPADFRNAAKVNEINEADWDAMLAMDLPELSNGSKAMPVEWLMRKDARLGRKLARWDVRLRNNFANHPDLKMRAWSSGAVLGQGKGKAGSATRAVMSSIFMFKGFPIMFFRNFMIPAAARALNGNGWPLGELVVFTTMMGIASIQIKEMLKGREPRKLDGKLAMEGMARGGSMGLIGDALFRDRTTFSGNILNELAGPLPSTSSEILTAIVANTQKQFDGDAETEAKWGRDAIKYGLRLTPGSTLWQVNWVLHTEMFATIADSVDPEYMERRRRQMRERAEKYEQNQLFNSGFFDAE